MAVDSEISSPLTDTLELTEQQTELIGRARRVDDEVAAPALWAAERGEYFPQEIAPAFRDAGLIAGTNEILRVLVAEQFVGRTR